MAGHDPSYCGIGCGHEHVKWPFDVDSRVSSPSPTNTQSFICRRPVGTGHLKERKHPSGVIPDSQLIRYAACLSAWSIIDRGLCRLQSSLHSWDTSRTTFKYRSAQNNVKLLTRLLYLNSKTTTSHINSCSDTATTCTCMCVVYAQFRHFKNHRLYSSHS